MANSPDPHNWRDPNEEQRQLAENAGLPAPDELGRHEFYTTDDEATQSISNTIRHIMWPDRDGNGWNSMCAKKNSPTHLRGKSIIVANAYELLYSATIVERRMCTGCRSGGGKNAPPGPDEALDDEFLRWLSQEAASNDRLHAALVKTVKEDGGIDPAVLEDRHKMELNIEAKIPPEHPIMDKLDSLAGLLQMFSGESTLPEGHYRDRRELADALSAEGKTVEEEGDDG